MQSRKSLHHGLDDAADQSGALLDDLVRRDDGLGHRRKDVVDPEVIERDASRLDGVRPFGDRHDAVQRLRDHQLGDTGRPDRLNLDVVAFDAIRRQHREQGIVAGVLIADNAELLAAQVGQGLHAGGLARHDLEQRLLAEKRHAAHGKPVRAHDHRGLAEPAADIGIADRDLLGDFDRATRGLHFELDILRGEVAAFLRNVERDEGGQRARRGKQIARFFRRRPRGAYGRCGDQCTECGSSRQTDGHVMLLGRLEMDRRMRFRRRAAL